MKNQRHSIKDIASALKVSVTTVSFIINGKGKEKRISEQVINKVLSYIKEINYKPNQLAQSLRTGQSKIIVFMVEDISNYFFAKLARIIEDIAYQKGYKVLFCSNDNEDEKSIELIKLFKDRQVDGYIIIPSPGIKKTIKNLLDDNLPVVLFDRYFEDLDTNYVIIDNEEATFNATKHLLGNNYKNIAFITTDVEQTQMLARLKGYQTAVQHDGLNEYILKIPYEAKAENRKETIKNFLLANPELDAIFFATNYLTHDGSAVIKENFSSLLEELGIITFDDNSLYDIFSPSISAVSQPLEEICRTLMTMMLKLLNKKNEPKTEKIVLNAKLRIRDSSMPKKRINN